ncbi:MAG: FAD-dependent oxidoreductase [Lachnospiraceae bacterium]|nr:FAD-dependent oxidoreductase [Lachnospiraceae bacterium]
MRKHELIFQPLKLRNFTVRNRIEVSPAEPFLCTRDGLITPEFIQYTAEMARGGAGIVTIGDSPINQAYADENHYVVNLADPYIVHGLVQLTEAIHRYGALASLELNLRDHRLPHEFTKAEMFQIIQDFADSARQCRKGGFDMVMVHGGHGHTVAQFFSPYFNKRTDEYGAQNFENRCRFAKELLDAVREAIGPDMAIEYRISGDELSEPGVRVEEAIAFAKEIEDKIDMIHVSAGSLYDLNTIRYQIQPAYIPKATNVRFAAEFKKHMNIPVTTVGSFDLDLAEEALAEGKADMVAMIRAFVADPDLVNKAKAGRADEIRPCIRCVICTGDDPHGCPKPLRCSVNPIAGRNLEFKNLPKAAEPKKVLIVGGGCAGLEAARRAAEAGHRPILVERSDHLGGTLIEAAACSLKTDIARYRDWSIHMVEKDPRIEVRLNTAADADLVRAEAPDAVIIAVGSDPFVPPVPGFDRDNVCLATEVDLGLKQVGHRVVCVGAGLTGTETAVALAQEGHDVTLVDMLTIAEIDAKKQASNMITSTIRVMQKQAGVKDITGVLAHEVNDEGLVVKHTDGTLETIPADSIVLSMGVRPRQKIVDELKDIVPDTFVVGDCNSRAGNITSAVREAFFAVMNLTER